MPSLDLNSTPEKEPLLIPKAVFNALSPLDQIAALALEKCGLAKIVEETEERPRR